MKWRNIVNRLFAAITVLAALQGQVRAALPTEEMTDDELSLTVGQALITVEKSYGNQSNDSTGNVVAGYPTCTLPSGKCGSAGMSFTRIVLDVDAYVNANIDMLELGNYGNGVSSCHASLLGACVDTRTSYSDIRANELNLGTTSNGTMQDLHLQDPYIEFAYQGDDGISGNTGNKRLAGIRIGAKSVDGIIGGQFMTLSGDFEGQVCLGICVNATLHGSRQTGICAAGGLACLNTQALGYLPIGQNGASPANNLYLSVENRNLWWPRFGTGPQGVAQAGYWINLQDGLTANLGSLSRTPNCWSGGNYC